MLEMLKALKENDGLTLKKGVSIVYRSGWQVADYGVECNTVEDAARAVEDMKGTCGVWYAGGVYYIDHSFRVDTKRKALEIGRAHNQISILRWKDTSLVYC